MVFPYVSIISTDVVVWFGYVVFVREFALISNILPTIFHFSIVVITLLLSIVVIIIIRFVSVVIARIQVNKIGIGFEGI